MYDVFISFKNLGEDGLPTRDSVLAKEIFDKLSGIGLDVFFSLVTLEKLGVSAYKYAIDKALDSASILVAVGTSKENLDSQWVRYEWDSFFNDIISGIKPKGRLFTCIEGCAIKSLPRVLRQSQVFDRSNGGIDKLINFISNSISIEHKGGGKGDEIDGKISMISMNERITLSKVENDDNEKQKVIVHNLNQASNIPFPAYKGKEPYIFISYSHHDSAKVYPIISEFYHENYNVWYDEGIESGIDSPEEIANALANCAFFMVFITPAAMESRNVRNEINYALTKELPFIAIYLEKTELPPGLQLLMGSKQAIFKYSMENESFKRKYTYLFETVLQASRCKITPCQRPVAEDPALVSIPFNAVEASVSSTQDRDMPVTSPVQTDITNECEWIGSKLIRYHGEEKEVTIPSRASILFSNAFKDNQEIERIIIPSSVSTIDFDAFENCPNLNQVVIEGRYVKIGDRNLPVSSRCDKLTFQCHRNSLTHKELVRAFSGPIVYFPGEEFEIEHGVLQKYFGNSKEVQLPAAVQIIGGFSFDKCLNLESLVMNDECGAILDNAFIYCPQLRNITLGKSFSSLAEGALRHIPYVKFSYYKHSMPKNLDQLFPDKSILSEISEAYKVTT